jgi:hypothetical protein
MTEMAFLNKRTVQMFDMERFHLEKLNNVKVDMRGRSEMLNKIFVENTESVFIGL